MNKKIMSKKIYSVLGCGWLGLPLAKQFVKEGITVKGSTTSNEKMAVLEEHNIKPYLINIDSGDSFHDFLETDVLLIMITSKKLEAYKNLVNVIEKSSIKKVVFISSTSVYPRGNKEYTEEDKTIDSLLVTVEKLLGDNKKFKTTIIRFAGLFGGQRQPGNWFKDKEIPQPNGFVNMIHREDCIAIICNIIQQDVFGEIFNACSNDHPTRKDFYTNAKKRLEMPAPIFDDSQLLQYKIIRPDKLINQLNYKFIHNDLLSI